MSFVLTVQHSHYDCVIFGYDMVNIYRMVGRRVQVNWKGFQSQVELNLLILAAPQLAGNVAILLSLPDIIGLLK